MKNSFLKILFISAVILVAWSASVFASNEVNAYLFYGEGCPHCAKEREYLFGTLQKEYPDLNIHEYEVYYNRDNVALFQEVAKKLNAEANGVPFLVIGDKSFVGYSESFSPGEIERQVEKCFSSGCSDLISSSDTPSVEKPVNLPILGDIDALKFSLPVLTIVMGLLDGFNPCAMWTLLFLISLLLGMQDKRRMWILGSAFIVTSALVYFIFMSAWLNLILFLGFVIWIRILIGLLALFGGGYSLKEFFVNKDSGCKVAGSEKRQKFFDKLKRYVTENNLWLALGGIVVLAFAVNLVELICSAGLPAIYTQVLALNNLPSWQYYLYILFYVFFFMLDDLLVFFVAMITFEITGITTKYSRVSRLVGGIVMLIIGLMLIFKPEWLMFG